jgi:hypothetical protein
MNLNTTTDSFSSLGKFITELKDLKQIDTFNFENFLRVYKNTDNQYFYNLLSNSINIDGDLDSSTYYEVRVEKSIPWTTISYNEYRTMHLWWLIMEVNKIRNPLEYPAPGTKLRILFPQYAKFVITKIIEKINSK